VRAIDELARELPDGVVVTDPGIMAGYRRDRADLVTAGTPVAVLRPVRTEQVSEVMRWASKHGVTVVPRGAGTGLAGGANAIDDCVILSLDRMTQIREIDPADQVAVVEAGVINADLDRAARAHGLFYAPDPGSFEISTIGGNIARPAEAAAGHPARGVRRQLPHAASRRPGRRDDHGHRRHPQHA
jgi:glycolate oxidase